MIYTAKIFTLRTKRLKIKKLEDGRQIDIELYNGDEYLVTLHSFYHTKGTLEKLLEESGFGKITWHEPLISKEGFDIMGKGFWEEYIDDCDVAYFSATKSS